MATNFKNIIGKEIGTQRVAVYTVPVATSTTPGMNIANPNQKYGSRNIEVGDEASNIGFLIKEMHQINPIEALGKGEKVVLDAGNVLYVTADPNSILM